MTCRMQSQKENFWGEKSLSAYSVWTKLSARFLNTSYGYLLFTPLHDGFTQKSHHRSVGVDKITTEL